MFTSDEKPAIGKQINRFLVWLDRIPLWWTGILIVVVFFPPILFLGMAASLRSTTSWMKAL